MLGQHFPKHHLLQATTTTLFISPLVYLNQHPALEKKIILLSSRIEIGKFLF